MIGKSRRRHTLAIVMALTACLGYLGHGGNAFGDSPPGQAPFEDRLGPASVPIASGTDVIATGTGMINQPGEISITVPGGDTIQQVLLYWSGQNNSFPSTSSIMVDGQEVEGKLIGGVSEPFTSGTYRADITKLNLIVPGANELTVNDLDFPVNDGAGVLVILDDESGAATSINLRDGSDYAYIGGSTPSHRTTVPQTFTFPAASVERTATLSMFFSSVFGTTSGGGFRPTSIKVTTNGMTQYFDNELDSNDGEEWDTLNLPVIIPAGRTSITVQALSEDRLGIGGVPASFFWLTAGLSVPPAGPELAQLGDRVWEDENVNGVQDCEDTNNNGIIGDAGDTGPECDAGIPGVPVDLLDGDCQTPLGLQDITDEDGFYLFPDLDPGDYCVEFGKPPTDDFCDTDGFELGEPQFTTQNAGNDEAVDSDADTATGITDPVNLSDGETDLTVDAGFFCPAKIGDRVWSDENENGIQDEGEEGVEDVKVTLFECGKDMIAGTDDDVETGQMRDTDKGGMYMFGAEEDFTLDPGKYFVQFMKPDGSAFTTPNVNGDAINSDCLPPDGITKCTTLGSRGINLNRDCGLIPPPAPECVLELDKKCRVETPPTTGGLECEAKIAATVLEYTGDGSPNAVTVDGKDTTARFDPKTGLLTVDARPKDLGSKITITTDGVEEVIHTSCSTPYVAGQPAPLDSPKGNPSPNWLVLSFVDKNGDSASVPGNGNGNGMFTDSCTVTPGSGPSCDTLKADKKKLSSLTFAYTGGGCPGDNDQGKKSSCSGSIDSSEGVTVQAGEKADKLNYPVQPSFVAPGKEFTIDPSKFKSNSVLVAKNTGGTETNEFHTSCSQPLAVGDVFGSFTVAAINGQRGSAEVTYQYVVTNNGDPLTGINLRDDKLGKIAGPFDLGTGESEIFTKLTRIAGTTVNTATASTRLNGQKCEASDKVKVEVKEPPSGGKECTTKISATLLRYTGPSVTDATVVFEPKDKNAGSVKYSNVDLVSGVTILKENGFTIDARPKDLGSKLTIKVNGEVQEVHHTSCSTPYIAGKPAPLDGNSPGKPSKGDPSPNWFVEGFEQK